MPDQDFGINIKTVADITGVRKAADAIAILNEQAKQSQQQAASVGAAGADRSAVLAEHVGRGFERVALHAIGVGAVLEAISGIKELAKEINAITESLDKQGEQLVSNSRQMIMQSKFAEDDADVLKIAEQGLKAIAAQHKIVEETEKKELSYLERAADIAQHIDPTTTGSKGANQARLEGEQAAARDSEAAQRRTAMSALATAEREKERRASQGLAQDIDELNGKIAHENQLKESAYARGDIQGYVEAAQAVKQYSDQLQHAIELQDKEAGEINKRIQKASPQTQRILENEEAARQASASGDTKSADMFQKTVDALKAGANPQQLRELGPLEKAVNENTAAMTKLWQAWQ